MINNLFKGVCHAPGMFWLSFPCHTAWVWTCQPARCFGCKHVKLSYIWECWDSYSPHLCATLNRNMHVFIGVIHAKNRYIYIKIPLCDIHIHIYIYLFIIYPSNDLICCIVNLAQVFAVWRWYIVIITCIVWLSNKAICTWLFPSLVLKRLYDAWYDADVQPPARPTCNLILPWKKSQAVKDNQHLCQIVFDIFQLRVCAKLKFHRHCLPFVGFRKLIGFTMWNLRMLSLYIQMLQAAPFKWG